jgi:predicted nuclease of predicted toxin-antitoxin system
MRLLADENVPAPSVAHLRAAGHDVAYVLEERPGIPDPEVAAWGHAEGRVVVTFDRDLGELLVRRGAPAPPGLVLLRFVPTTPTHAGEVVAALAARSDLTLVGRLTVVDSQKVRQRPLPSAS